MKLIFVHLFMVMQSMVMVVDQLIGMVFARFVVKAIFVVMRRIVIGVCLVRFIFCKMMTVIMQRFFTRKKLMLF